jgi:hypothetical protein
MHLQSPRHTLVSGYPMNVMEHFEYVGSRGFYRPVAQVSFEQAVDMVADAMRTARELGLADLLVNSTGLTGFTPPSVFARYEMVRKWLEAGGSALRVAMVARAELHDPQKIGVLMLQNRGGTGDAFLNEVEAIAWLDARLAPGQRGSDTVGRARTEE